MSKIKYSLSAASILLLLAGQGCPAPQKEAAPGVEPEAGVEVETGAKVEAPAVNAPKEPTGVKVDINASVDSILKSADDEAGEEKKVESEADEVKSDSADLNAYGESTYEVK